HTCSYRALSSHGRASSTRQRFSSAFKQFHEELAGNADAQSEAKGAGPPLAQSRGQGHLARERRLNGEENTPRTPHARPDPRRVAAASFGGVAWSHDRITATAA